MTLLRSLALVATTWLALSSVASAQDLRAPPPGIEVRAWEPASLPEGWTTLAQPGLEVSGPSQDHALLDELARHTVEAVPRLAKRLDVPIGSTIRLFVARTPDDFRTLQPGRPPPWADGTAYPDLGAIFLRHPSLRGGTATPLEQVLDHELVHVLLGRAFAPARPPAWLQEGVAQVLAGEAGPDVTHRLSRALLGQSALTLAQLDRGFPSDARRADLAYAQSADFVQWLQVTYGEGVIADLVKRSRQGEGLAGAVRAITGHELDDVDAAWVERLVSSTPVWTSPENMEGILFGGGGLILLVGGYLRRRALTQRLVRWREDRSALSGMAREILGRRQGPDDA